ncbi:LOW QUALITY PROTEIN: hypothetical protein PHMEG_00019414 [Phytophthora megakarya]|uniref:PiggyBac transposable element-derived protein domain-containing protein n=1 Tax=Phytophthora megakarya TaxID=4795 RepID=A0A225VRL3_9STRA|nr:LOW QUALITY PROTEIN: hypothetical protein PHMEG_00019414 [Phytophthora megakarya]
MDAQDSVEQQQGYDIDNIAVEALVDDWDRILQEEHQHELELEHGADAQQGASDTQNGIDEFQQAIDAFLCNADGVTLPSALEVIGVHTQSVHAPSSLGRAYMDSLNMQNGLHIVAPARVIKAYRDNAEYGLFALFVTAAYGRTLLTWTSDVLASKGQPKLTESELNAYCGLEIAMSICPLSDIAEYWSESRFLGQSAFKEIMARTRFQNIRSVLQFHAPGDPTLDKLLDPPWHSPTIPNHFEKQSRQLLFLLGIDEMTTATKARSRARTYMSSKPDIYGIRFYAVVG